jgi:hypothetical protein
MGLSLDTDMKNRSAVALTLAVPTDVPIEASHN